MKKLSVLITDDESLAHTVLKEYCDKLDYLQVVGNCYDGVSALRFLSQNKVDLLLLDIQLPDLSGFELLDSLRDRAPKVIFTTAFSEYALNGFDYDQVVDYLHKPIRMARFIKATERLRKLLALEHQFLQQSGVQTLEKQSESSEDFVCRKGNKTVLRIPLAEILYIQSWGNYLKFFLANNDVKMIRKTIKSAEKELAPHAFQQIHKSYIVNLSHVDGMAGNAVLISEEKLPVGNSYLVATKRCLLSR